MDLQYHHRLRKQYTSLLIHLYRGFWQPKLPGFVGESIEFDHLVQLAHLSAAQEIARFHHR